MEEQIVRKRLNNPVGAVPPAVVRTDPPVPPPRCESDFSRKVPFFKFRLTVAVLMVILTLYLPFFISGFLWGMYLCVVGALYAFMSKPMPMPRSKLSEAVIQKVSEEIDRQRSEPVHVVYKGWMNELVGRYDPATYHVDKTRSVLVRLDGKFLRLSRPERNVHKHAYWYEPTLSEPDPTMVGESLFDLTNAVVTLRPKSLAPRRWWVRKYPIHIRLASRDSGITARKFDKRDSTPDDSDSSAYNAEDDDEKAPQQQSKTRKRSKSADAAHPALGHVRVPKGKGIYLFVRTPREKERWFHRLRETCSQYRTVEDKGYDSASSLPEMGISDAATMSINSEYFLYISSAVQFSRYMADVLCSSPVVEMTSPQNGIVDMDLGRYKYMPSLVDDQSAVHAAVNALASRIFYDFCRDEVWLSLVRDRIQSKLATLHLPYFIETLELSKLVLGANAPKIVGVHSPLLNEWGLWLDLELSYSGGLQLVIETKVNLMKLKTDKKDGPQRKTLSNSVEGHYYSDEERPQSPESDPEEEFGSTDDKQVNSGSKGKKILSFMDRLTHSSIFQGVTDLKPIKNMMKGISSTRLILNVEVTGLEGTLAINIPPPPSDRLWIGFRIPPKLTLKAVPQFGDRAVDFTVISDWIENQLGTLLEKNLVMPGMDDTIIPVMSGNEMLKFGYNK